MLFGRTSWQRPQPQLTTTTTITTATTSGSWDGLHNELRKKNLQNPPSHTAILGLDFGWRKSWQKGASYRFIPSDFHHCLEKILRQSEIFREPCLNDFLRAFRSVANGHYYPGHYSLQKTHGSKVKTGCLIGPLWSSHQPESERQGRHGFFANGVCRRTENPTKISKQVQEI